MRIYMYESVSYMLKYNYVFKYSKSPQVRPTSQRETEVWIQTHDMS